MPQLETQTLAQKVLQHSAATGQPDSSLLACRQAIDTAAALRQQASQLDVNTPHMPYSHTSLAPDPGWLMQNARPQISPPSLAPAALLAAAPCPPPLPLPLAVAAAEPP